jgi:leucyl-tRNA synthetase
MIAVNELQTMKCNKRQILEPLTILLSPFAPHITEELWHMLGHDSSIYNAAYPDYDESYLVENTFEYPVSFNGKMRFKINLPVDMPQAEIEQKVLKHEKAQKWLEGKSVRKFIVVPKRIINVVIG